MTVIMDRFPTCAVVFPSHKNQAPPKMPGFSRVVLLVITTATTTSPPRLAAIIIIIIGHGGNLYGLIKIVAGSMQQLCYLDMILNEF